MCPVYNLLNGYLGNTIVDIHIQRIYFLMFHGNLQRLIFFENTARMSTNLRSSRVVNIFIIVR